MFQHNQNANSPIRVYNLAPPGQPNEDKKGSVPYLISMNSIQNANSKFQIHFENWRYNKS